MANLLEIARGWHNFLTSPPELRGMANMRLMLCDTCPHKVELNNLTAAVITLAAPSGTPVQRSTTFKCGKCNCPLSAKIFSPNSKCPINRW